MPLSRYACAQDDGADWPTMEDDGPAVASPPDAVEGTSDETITDPSFAKFLSSAIIHLARAASRARWARSWVKVWLSVGSIHRIT